MSVGQGMYRCKQCGELVLGQASHLCAARPDPPTSPSIYPQERIADALERIADALEQIAQGPTLEGGENPDRGRVDIYFDAAKDSAGWHTPETR